LSIRGVLKYLYTYIYIIRWENDSQSINSILSFRLAPQWCYNGYTDRRTSWTRDAPIRRGPRRQIYNIIIIIVSSISGLAVGAHRCCFVVPNFVWRARSTVVRSSSPSPAPQYSYDCARIDIIIVTCLRHCRGTRVCRCLVSAGDSAGRLSDMKRFCALYAAFVPITAGEWRYIDILLPRGGV